MRKSTRMVMVCVFLVIAGAAGAEEPDPENAATYYEKAFDMISDFTKLEIFGNLQVVMDKGFSEEHKELREYLEAHHEVFALVATASKKSRCDFLKGKPLTPATPMSHLVHARRLGMILVLNGRLHEYKGDMKEALQNYLNARMLGQHLSSDRCLTSKLLQVTIDRMTETPLREFVSKSADIELQDWLLGRLLALWETGVPMHVIFDREKQFCLWAGDRIFDDLLKEIEKERAGNEGEAEDLIRLPWGVLTEFGEAWPLPSLLPSLWTEGNALPREFEEKLAELDEEAKAKLQSVEPYVVIEWYEEEFNQGVEDIFGKIIEAARSADFAEFRKWEESLLQDEEADYAKQIQPLIHEMTGLFETLERGEADPDETVEKIYRLNGRAFARILLNKLTPAFSRALCVEKVASVNSRAIMIGLALNLYKSENGEFPDSLHMLISERLPQEILIDPFSGKPLRYQKMDEGYVLWSIGPDMIDDKGEVAYDRESSEETGDIIYRHHEKTR